MSSTRKQIVLSEKNWDALRKLGCITNSFDDIITQLIKEHQQKQGVTLTA
jgi:hypothetical protein